MSLKSILSERKEKKKYEEKLKSLEQYRDENGVNLSLSEHISINNLGMHLILGASGAGKDRCHILPNVAHFDHDMFFVENDGTLRKKLTPHLEEHRYRILIFNKENAENTEYLNKLVDQYESLLKQGLPIAVFLEVDDSVDPIFYETFLKLCYAKRALIFRAFEGTKDEGTVRRVHFYMNDIFPYFCIGTFYYIIETCQLDNAGFSILSKNLNDIKTAFEIDNWFESFVSHCKSVTLLGNYGEYTEPIFRRVNMPVPKETSWNLVSHSECFVHIRGEEFIKDSKLWATL